MQDTPGKDIAGLIVDPDTGEIIDDICTGDKIVRRRTSEYLRTTTEFGKGKKFIKLFDSTISALGNEALTGNQWKILTTVLRYFRYDSGLVSYANGRALTVSDITRLSGVGTSSAFDAIEKLVTKKILSKNKTGHDIRFFVNPFIFSHGTRINKTLYAMFENSKWAKIYEEN